MSSIIFRDKAAPIAQRNPKIRPFLFKSLLICLLVSFCLPVHADTAQIKLVTWNIANFWHQENIALRLDRKGQTLPGRTSQDYQKTSRIIREFQADLIALQEIGSPEAAEILFPAQRMKLLFSPRFQDKMNQNPDHLNSAKQRDIYTALAYRPKTLKLLKTERLRALTLPDLYPHLAISPLREPTIAQFHHIASNQQFWVVSLHLKSGCFRAKSPEKSRKSACQKLSRQAKLLQKWAQDKINQGQSVILMGDFNHQLDRGHASLRRLFQPSKSANAQSYFYKTPHKRKILCPAFSKTPRTTIDYILISNDLIKKADLSTDQLSYPIQDRDISDHCPIQADLRFRP